MNELTLIPLKEPVIKKIEIPGSKSYTNRALIMSSLTRGEVNILNPLFSDDTEALINCLKQLGISITVTKKSIIVSGDISEVKNSKIRLNTNLSGTSIRFLTALCCLVPGEKILEGGEGLNKRPIGELVDGLRQLGATIEYINNEGFPPVKITSSELKPGTAVLNGDISSQYFSAILMIAPRIGETKIKVSGNQISKPYIDMTIDTMKEFGVKVVNDNYREYIVPGQQTYIPKTYTVEGDYSSAGYFLALAALTGSEITLENLNPESRQADRNFLDALKQIDPGFTYRGDSGKYIMQVKGTGKLVPVIINMENFPDQVQTMAVLAAFAKGKTVISGVRSLRVKETERVKALQNELLKMGIKTDSSSDTLTIFGGNPNPAPIDTYGDHRMAMSFAVAGAKIEGIKIRNPEVVSKTFPDFWSKLKRIGVKNEI